jgi:NADH:ubiquinone oxidoreductase subunit K
MIAIEYFVILSTLIFSIGLFGIFTQTNAIRILICVELMINGAIINFVAFNSLFGTVSYEGWTFALVIIAIAAAEAAIGLAIFISVYRSFGEITLGNIFSLRESSEGN